jgi:glycosyltransferase involved in cell wall biosynthesis
MKSTEIDMVLPYPLGDPYGGLAGSARILLDLAGGFVARGHHPRVLARTSPSVPTHEKVNGIEILRLKPLDLPRALNVSLTDRLDLPFLVPLIFQNLKKNGDVMITFNDPWPCLVPKASFKIFSLHIPNPHLTPKNKLVQKMMNADLTLCCSRYVADRVQRYAPGISRKITYVHNGIDYKKYEMADGDTVRQKLGFKPDEVVLMYAGQINELKGLAYLVAALRRVRSDSPGVSLMVLGSSTLWPRYDIDRTNRAMDYEMRVRSEASNLPVRFAGLVPESEKASYFAACDVFVCPSVWNEPFGLTNLEAMAAGKPVVASRVGGIPEVVQDGETGILVPPKDTSKLANAISSLIRDKDARKRMGAKGSEAVRTRFSLDSMVDGYLREIG